MPVLEINNITKHYKTVTALNNVSFSVPEGSVYGILGPNGSGKTTLLGIILDILKPSSGSFTLLGKPADAEVRKQVGTLLETPNFYHYLSGERNLRVAAHIKGKGFNEIDNVLQKVNLYQRKLSKFNTYSLGMKQRLAIASCLLGDPQVLIFDEPTNGLDPNGIAEIRELIQRLAQEGKTIIMASHLLDEVEKVCTHVAIIKNGNLLTAGSVDEVLVADEIIEVASDDLIKLEEVLQQMGGFSSIKKHNNVLQLFFVNGNANAAAINQYCFNNNIALNHLQVKKKSLETKFLELTNKV
ncbi:ABC transporter ATP-binding protein [Parafilimonas sp.]|uniref:ABC transporter ATP-binding protein n=1 Tax=Parafilimonas sp. TaxID=1969739 RepID=UPI003F7ED477